MHSEALDIFGAARALRKNPRNTEPRDFRAGSDLGGNLIQIPGFTDKAGNKMTHPRSHSWLAKVYPSVP